MKTTVNKCEYCKAIIEDNKEYDLHIEHHRSILCLEGAFPRPEIKHGKFIQRDKKWLNLYKEKIKEIVAYYHPNYEKEYGAFSYGWYRCLDDSGSMFYGYALRVQCVCPKCYKEYDQPHFANNCKCEGEK